MKIYCFQIHDSQFMQGHWSLGAMSPLFLIRIKSAPNFLCFLIKAFLNSAMWRMLLKWAKIEVLELLKLKNFLCSPTMMAEKLRKFINLFTCALFASLCILSLFENWFGGSAMRNNYYFHISYLMHLLLIFIYSAFYIVAHATLLSKLIVKI